MSVEMCSVRLEVDVVQLLWQVIADLREKNCVCGLVITAKWNGKGMTRMCLISLQCQSDSCDLTRYEVQFILGMWNLWSPWCVFLQDRDEWAIDSACFESLNKPKHDQWDWKIYHPTDSWNQPPLAVDRGSGFQELHGLFGRCKPLELQ